jgi:hypothetical protein
VWVEEGLDGGAGGMLSRAQLQRTITGKRGWFARNVDVDAIDDAAWGTWKLVSVRYVYDAERRKRYTTVELIVEAVAWDPYRWRLDPETEVPIRTEWGESELEASIEKAGGWWDRAQRRWMLTYEKVLALRLEERITLARTDLELRSRRKKPRSRSIPASTNT